MNHSRWHGRLHLFMHHVLDGLRAGKSVAQIAKENDCTRAWIYLILKESGLDIADFKWYRNFKRATLTPATRAVATLLVSKHIKIRVRGRMGSLWVLDGDRPPIKLIVHTMQKPHRTNPAAKIRYFSIQVRKKGAVHVVPIDQQILVIKANIPRSGINVPERLDKWRPIVQYTIALGNLADIEILDALRSNVRD